MSKYYKIFTYGCQMNVHESEKLAGMFLENGYSSTDDDQKADFIILNTCCVRESAETHVLGNLGFIKKLKESKRSLKVAVCGCMTQAEGAAEKLKKRCPFIDLIFGTHNLHMFSSYLKELAETHKKQIAIWDNEKDIVENIPVLRTSGVNAWVNIMYGCNNFCSYCIVPYVRGRERSRNLQNILKDIRDLLQQGYKQITLLGQNVNSYGHDLSDQNINFASLLEEIDQLDGNFRLKFMTSHPKDISEEVIRVIAKSNKIAHYIHMPIQSGSDAILDSMNRKYTAKDYLSKIEMIRSFMPEVGISGDVMVGYPGETHENFLQTLDVIKQIRYQNLYTFIYSKRSGTPAAKMENQIDISVKRERIKKIIDMQFDISNDLAKASIGKTYDVLCESYKDGKLFGKTQYDQAVSIKADASYLGCFVKVEIAKNTNSKLIGVII